MRDAIRRAGVAFLSWLPIALSDGFGLVGLGAVAYGAYLLARPAGFIVGGLELVALCALLTAGRR